MSQASPHTYQLKVTLRHSKPPIWRRFLVSSSRTLAHLHDVLQIVMGWEDAHLHAFTIDESRYTSEPQSYDDSIEEKSVPLSTVITSEGQKFNYEYDFGDSWHHTILVEKILPIKPGQVLPLCLTGKRACPPEDCGGIYGYDNFVEAIKNDDHPEHEDLTAWAEETCGADFDPAKFDRDAVNAALKSLSAS